MNNYMILMKRKTYLYIHLQYTPFEVNYFEYIVRYIINILKARFVRYNILQCCELISTAHRSTHYKSLM